MDILYTNLLDTGLTVEPFAAEDAVRAAEHVTASRAARTPKDDRSLSLGDGLCLCLAVAERLNLPVTGGDGHWNELNLDVKFYPLTMR